MVLHPQSLPLVPAATAAVVRAAFPKGNLYVDLRDECGPLYNDQLFADLYPKRGRPVIVAPWRLACVLILQYSVGLTDRQAADAVRRCRDWKHVLSRELTDRGFDFTLLDVAPRPGVCLAGLCDGWGAGASVVPPRRIRQSAGPTESTGARRAARPGAGR
jgi:hypothetical protein